MSKLRIIMTFNDEVAAEPIIYSIGQDFALQTNIRQANMSESGGWIEVELEGDSTAINGVLDWATSKGVKIEPATV